MGAMGSTLDPILLIWLYAHCLHKIWFELVNQCTLRASANSYGLILLTHLSLPELLRLRVERSCRKHICVHRLNGLIGPEWCPWGDSANCCFKVLRTLIPTISLSLWFYALNLIIKLSFLRMLNFNSRLQPRGWIQISWFRQPLNRSLHLLSICLRLIVRKLCGMHGWRYW